jgi:hypothetical protein
MSSCPKCDKFTPLVDHLVSIGIPIFMENWETSILPMKPKYPPQLTFLNEKGEITEAFRPIDLSILSRSIALHPELHNVSSAEEHLLKICQKRS